ncbi:unnamed protein product [Menidia menidia]|uniref:(Atlantic silverside) hypothetical protein n=1 Tax=Menidia menidia TaxID=238744 RepID=A0A8S4B8D5_9TELE|nr:unnamed protein product [Menidia menidia]
MEPLDPAKNVDSGGFSKRRISSILKAPRKSTLICDPEQQENKVESTKAVEKRNSRRVSFAPANDVLLFAKDAKNSSPARSPLQELITASIENLLSAPLHISQQRDMVSADGGNDGEQTVMFSTEDAVMDMTHSHTINIASDAQLLGDIPLQNNDVILKGREQKGAVDGGSADMSLNHTGNITSTLGSLLTDRNADLSNTEKKNISKVASMDPGFENFLASLSKTSSSSNAGITKRTPLAGSLSEETNFSLGVNKTPRDVVDKENLVPKSLNTTKKTVGPLQGFFPGDDVSMDISAAQTGPISGTGDDDDPFQCLFPSEYMYARASQMAELKQQQSSEIVGAVDLKEITLKNPPSNAHQRPVENISTEEDYREKTVRFSADDACMNETQSHTVNIATGFKPQLPKSGRSSPTCGEKTVKFSVDDAAMDITQCLTVNIANNMLSDSVNSERKHEGETCGPPENRYSSTHSLDPGYDNLLASLSIPSDGSVRPAQSIGQTIYVEYDSVMDMTEPQTGGVLEGDVSMDMTEVQTSRIFETTGADYLASGGMYQQGYKPKKTETTSHLQSSGEPESSNSHGMEKFLKTSLQTTMQRQQIKLEAEDVRKDKTIRFFCDDACRDVTQSHTAKIVTNLPLLSKQNIDMPASGEKTVRFSAYDAAMDVTKSHTVNISTDLNLLSHQNLDYLTANGEKTMRFTAKSADMDMTRSLTVNIDTDLDTLPQKNEDFLPAIGEKTVRFSAFDAAMDVTKSHTVNISTDLNLLPQKKLDYLTASEEKTTRFTAKSAAMDMTRSLTVNIATDLEALPQKNEDLLHAGGEKTVRFSTDNAAMEVTRSHTVNIATDLVMETHQNEDLLPARGEKTVRFGAYDAAMDVTKSHTVNISTDLNLLSHQNLGVLSSNGEKTMRFTEKSAAMDMTRSLTVNIATDLDTLPQKKEDLLPAGGEKTVRFSTDDAAMDVTKSHTVNIATDLDTLPQQPVDLLPASGKRTARFAEHDDAMDVRGSRSTTATHFETSNVRTEAVAVRNTPRALAHDPTANNSTNFERKPHLSADLVPPHGEKTVRFTTSDAAMEMTHSLTVNIASNSTFSLPDQTEERVKKSDSEDDAPHLKVASSADSLDGKLKNLLAEASGPLDGQRAHLPHTPFPPETLVSADCQGQLKRPKSNTSAENEAPGLVSTFEKPVNKTVADCSEISASMDMTEVQTGCILEQTYSDEPPDSRSFDPVRKNGLSSRNTEALVISSPNALEITNPPHYPDSNETEATKPGPAACPVTQKLDSSPGVDTKSARTSRRMSLADLQSKVRRLSHMINAAPEETATDICTAPLAQSDPDLEENPEARAPSLPGAEPEPEVSAGNGAEQPSEITPATPFNLQTKRLMSRLSVGGFKAKLPRRSNAEEVKKMTAAASAANQLKESGNDVSDIDDEELGSCEDMSETLDGRSPDHVSAVELASLEWDVFEPSKEDLFQEGRFGPVHRHKRPLPEDEVKKEDEKRLRACSEFVEPALQSDAADCERDVTTAQAATQNVDSSSHSHTASRCETAYESTIKHSLFESYLEDYNSDVQKKLEDGTITVLEFFKLFNIDFVIHNPRQSVVPGRLLSDTDSTPMDLLKDRHISRPKQLVYDSDIQSLTERVEGLKVRMQDLDKHLKAVNRALWEEMRHSTEEEIKSFGAKLKERNNFFRKMSKVQSHEMKELLYSNLVQANMAEQQKLRGKIEEADVMIKSLDDCIGQLQAELTAVEEKGSEDKPSLKTLQEEMKRVTERLADSDRQITELEMQKKQNSSKLTRLKAETRNLENHVDVLNELNEWKFREKKDDCSVYSFLHETMLLQLVYEKSSGSDADIESEQKITSIAFKLELDDEKSQFHARLVHKLVSQYVEGEPAWVEKYPTSRHLPKLLHDISLVVSRCRLLGEELRLLKTWGALRLNILHIDCTGTRVHVVFSSLKTFSKFEVVFSVGLGDQSYVLHVESFKNITGSTTIQQIEEIMTSFTPARNLLTRIIKKINNTLLC